MQKSLVIRNAIASGCFTKSLCLFICLLSFVLFFSGDAAVVGCLFVCLYVAFTNKLAEGGPSSL